MKGTGTRATTGKLDTLTSRTIGAEQQRIIVKFPRHCLQQQQVEMTYLA